MKRTAHYAFLFLLRRESLSFGEKGSGTSTKRGLFPRDRGFLSGFDSLSLITLSPVVEKDPCPACMGQF